MSTLFVVPTPIGNLKDITLRAMDVLRKCEVIACEDTRVTRKLLTLLEIDYSNKKLISNFEHNERQNIERLIEVLQHGEDIALVTDAGMPLLSDPGFPLLRHIRSKQINNELSDIKIEVLPGASSIPTALVQSGFPTDKFSFLGFFPRKPNEMKKLLKNARKSSEFLKVTYIAFDSQYRIAASLQLINETLGSKAFVCVCNELTKMHERVVIGRVNDVLEKIQKKQINISGEIVVIFRLEDDFTS